MINSLSIDLGVIDGHDKQSDEAQSPTGLMVLEDSLWLEGDIETH